MELSNVQLEKVNQFLKDQKVMHLDLRLELIDHLSTEIEDLLQRVSVKSFDQAFIEIERKYATGLLKTIKDQKYKSLNDYWNQRFKLFLKSYFTLPKIIVTISLMIGFCSLSQITLGNTSLLLAINILLSLVGFISVLFILINAWIKNKRLLIVESYGTRIVTPFMIFQIVYQFETAFEYSPSASFWYLLLLAFTNTIYSIAIYGIFFPFRRWLNEEIEKAYPSITSIA